MLTRGKAKASGSSPVTRELPASRRKKVGTSTNGAAFHSVEELWEQKNSPAWYTDAASYWEKVPATVDGVLGGFGTLAPVDEKGSRAYLDMLIRDKKLLPGAKGSHMVALDVGAGVGRVTKNVLLSVFDCVDLLEQDRHFCDQAIAEIPQGLGHVFCKGMQDFEAQPGRYDCIWIQWVIGHLTDDAFVAFMGVLQRSLKPHGIIVLKDNVCREGFIVDDDDSSVTRDDTMFRALFTRAGLRLVHSLAQEGFPQEIFPVLFYTLQPSSSSSSSSS